LYYVDNIKMQVGVRTFYLLKHSTNIQHTKYTLGYVDSNLSDVSPTAPYTQFICLNAKIFAHV